MRLLQGPVLPPDIESRLLQESNRRKYRKHDLICTADAKEDIFFIVVTGFLRVFFSHISGREFSLATLEPGALFTSHAGLNVEALQDSEIEVVDASLIVEIMAQEERLSRYLIGVVGEVLGTSLQCIESLVFEDLECRLAQYLLEQVRPILEEKGPLGTVNGLSGRSNIFPVLTDWAASDGTPGHTQPLQPIPLMHDLSVEEISKFVGSSRQSVSLLLNNWQREGIISHQHRRIIIEDLAKLRSIGYPSG